MKKEIVVWYCEGLEMVCYVNLENLLDVVIEWVCICDWGFGFILFVFVLVGGGGVVFVICGL